MADRIDALTLRDHHMHPPLVTEQYVVTVVREQAVSPALICQQVRQGYDVAHADARGYGITDVRPVLGWTPETFEVAP